MRRVRAPACRIASNEHRTRPRSPHRSWPPSPIAARRSTRTLRGRARAPSTSNPPDTAMNMPMIRNRNGDGSDRPAPRMHSTSRGSSDQPESGDGRRGTDRDRGLVERVHLRLQLRIRMRREHAVHPVPSSRLGGGPSIARRPEAEGGSSHSVLFGRSYTESSPSPPHGSSVPTAFGEVMNHDSK